MLIKPPGTARPSQRAQDFAAQLGIRVPILLAPMAGACPPSLSIAVANAGGLGACGALLMKPEEITHWAAEFRKDSQGEFQINLWIPDPPAKRDARLEEQQREFLKRWGPPVPPEAGDAVLPDFEAQCQAMLSAAPKVISSIMGVYPPAFVSEMKRHGILWFAVATTVGEARAAEKAGADAIVAQGMEAGGQSWGVLGRKCRAPNGRPGITRAAGRRCRVSSGGRNRRNYRWKRDSCRADPGG